MVFRRHLLPAVVAATLGSIVTLSASTQPAATATFPFYVIATSHVGWLPTKNATFDRAVLVLGPLSPPFITKRVDATSCTFESRNIGLLLGFGRSAPRNDGSTSNCTDFARAVVSKKPWHTANGLQVGASVAVMKKLFPRASNTKLSPTFLNGVRGVEWQLTPKDTPERHAVLDAFVLGGRVVALGIDFWGH